MPKLASVISYHGISFFIHDVELRPSLPDNDLRKARYRGGFKPA